ncbi:ATP-binding cassette domain-containing protein [Neoroseomonas soli]|uniref:ATP-binding cassette domain-containing protein n=1 Tax=Neoroseomonas soli TaxID=1081025 RepID=A0A9X9X1I8_9PROT|nr:ATP-binding cassette domain-containing protein [Neoroseomonas soli]MBR0673267.1 ATP-binding cassette domain-containing protein [Neoroseomonas soli]
MSATLSLPAPPRAAAAPVVPVLLLCILLSVAVQATLLTTPLLTMHVFDSVLESRSLDTLWVLAAAFLAVLMLGGVLRHLRAALLASMAERAGRRLELRALAATVRVSLAGERVVAARALQDVAALRRLLGGSVPADVLDLLSIPLALGFLWMLHPLFFTVAFVAALVQAAIGVLADRAARGTLSAATQAEGFARRELIGRLGQRDLVLGLGLLPAVLARFAPVHAQAVAGRGRAEGQASALAGLLQLGGFAQQIAVVGTGVWLLLEHRISPGSMIAAATMVNLAIQPVMHLVGHWRDWSEGIAAARRLANVVRRGAPPAPVGPDASAPPGLMIEGLTLRAPGAARPMLEGLHLSLAPGQAVLLAGPNGAGKTTLLRAILGLAEPEAGRVLLDGCDTLRTPRGETGPRLGYLPQDAQLLDGSVIENIGRFAAEDARSAVAAARQVGAHEAIGRLPRGYESAAGPEAGLSGGQARLVSLARAFHGAPRLIVLDEPEAGLDAAARAGLRQAVATARDDGAVMLVVSHDPTPWHGVVDGVLRLAGDGTWSLEMEA